MYDDKNEWQASVEWMWENREVYNGLSVLDYDGGTYVQAPFEDITEEEYNKLSVNLKTVNFSGVVEMDDNVEFGQTAACAGGACEIEI
jgi:ribonucleoside-diphosphate reductase alpha chain